MQLTSSHLLPLLPRITTSKRILFSESHVNGAMVRERNTFECSRQLQPANWNRKPYLLKPCHPMPPRGLTRDRQIDICAQCHAGAGEPVAPALSFRPGERISEYVRLQAPGATDRLDVHGNQVNLLERSRCFQLSPEMSCSTCHDVHRPERPAPEYSSKCLDCHRVDQCGMFPKTGNRIASNCIDCHMPVQASSALVLDTEDQRLQAKVRTHWIRVYRSASRP